MKIFLVIIFTINGHPSVIGGHLPREQPNQEVCESRALFTLDYLFTLKEKLPPVRVVDCVKAETAVEAIEMFGAKAGELV